MNLSLHNCNLLDALFVFIVSLMSTCDFIEMCFSEVTFAYLGKIPLFSAGLSIVNSFSSTNNKISYRQSEAIMVIYNFTIEGVKLTLL